MIAFQATGMEREPFRATLAGCFLVQGLVALCIFWANDLVTNDVGRAFVVGMPAVVVGTIVGERLTARLHGRAFRAAVLGLLTLSGALAVAGALTS